MYMSFASKVVTQSGLQVILKYMNGSKYKYLECIYEYSSLSSIHWITFFFSGMPAACGILAPLPGIESRPSAGKAWSPNHWTATEFPR